MSDHVDKLAWAWGTNRAIALLISNMDREIFALRQQIKQLKKDTTDGSRA